MWDRGIGSGRGTNVEGEETLVQLADQPDHLVGHDWHDFCISEVERIQYPG